MRRSPSAGVSPEILEAREALEVQYFDLLSLEEYARLWSRERGDDHDLRPEGEQRLAAPGEPGDRRGPAPRCARIASIIGERAYRDDPLLHVLTECPEDLIAQNRLRGDPLGVWRDIRVGLCLSL